MSKAKLYTVVKVSKLTDSELRDLATNRRKEKAMFNVAIKVAVIGWGITIGLILTLILDKI